MKLTRKQRIALGALGCTTAALIADKTLLSPQTAMAQAPDSSASPGQILSPEKSMTSPESISANLRIVSIWESARSPDTLNTDPFAWHLPQQPQPDNTEIMTFEQAATTWTVTGIMGTKGNRIAVINHKPARVDEFVVFSGDDNRRAKIVEIRENSVVFYFDGKTVSAHLLSTTLSGVNTDQL